MRAIPRSDWAELCEAVNRRTGRLHAIIDAGAEHRTVGSVDYAPFDDVVEIVLSTPTGDLRILIDQPDQLLASDDSDPYFSIVVESNDTSIVLRDAMALEPGQDRTVDGGPIGRPSGDNRSAANRAARARRRSPEPSALRDTLRA